MNEDRKKTEGFQPKTVGQMLEQIEKEEKQKKSVFWKAASAVITIALTVLAVFAVKAMFEKPEQKNSGQVTIEENKQNQEQSTPENTIMTTEGTKTANSDANGKTQVSDKKLTGVRQSNLMGSAGGNLFAAEGDYLFSVKKDAEGIQNDKIVITKTMDGGFETVAELEEKQPVQEFYVKKNRLAVITSDEESSTSVHFYNIKNKSDIHSVTKSSLDGAWESSCLQDRELYTFTKEGYVGRFLVNQKQQNQSPLKLGEKDARYFMSGSEVYSFSDSNEKISVQKYILEQNRLVKVGKIELGGMTENIIAVTKSSQYLKVALSNRNHTNGEITFYYVDEDMKGSRKIENERNNELVATARFLSTGEWRDKILCFGRGTDSKGNLTGGIALTMFEAGDSENGSSEGNTYLIKEADSAAVCTADRVAFLDDEKQQIGFDAYIQSGENVEHKYYLLRYTGKKFDLVSEVNLGSSRLEGEVYGRCEDGKLEMVDKKGGVEVYEVN